MTETPIAVIFDLDGTLVDTAPDLLASLNFVLTGAGHRAVEPKELRNLVGLGVRHLFLRAFAATGADVPSEILDKHCADFLVYYRDHIAVGSKPFPHVPETLDRLGGQGALMGVCTNKPHELTGLLLDRLALARYFPAVHGGGRAPYNKPDPRHVIDVVESLKGNRRRAVFVGDSVVDVEAARAAGLPVIAMSYGYSPTPVSELGADAVTDDFSELPDLIGRLVG